jgi:choline dehydrogenase-like flavoprotein
MEHHMYWGGDMFVTDSDAVDFDADGDAFFAPSVESLLRREILNFHIQLESMPFHGVKGVVHDIACVAPETTEWLSHKLGQHLQCSSRVHVAWEQAPRPENRVALSSGERDADGVPRIELHWKKDELDRRTLVQAMRMFGENCARSDLGRVHISDWVLNGEPYPDNMELAGNHHMGGTRMHDDPAFGVVDRDCRVHGMKNLFVGGSSVFTTSGQCTPTVTLTALAVRLGHHLVSTISGS